MADLFLNVQSLKDVVRDAVLEAMQSLNEEEKRKQYYTKHELCEMLHVSLMTVNNYVERKLLKPNKIGRRVLFDADEVQRAIKECTLLKYNHVQKGGKR